MLGKCFAIWKSGGYVPEDGVCSWFIILDDRGCVQLVHYAPEACAGG